jgi:sugar O-acyltransferase (sialic acid O-acetyltransferase NeuD family)
MHVVCYSGEAAKSGNLAFRIAAMKRVVIIGAGGHGCEVAEIIRHQAQSESGPTLLGFVVDSEYLPEGGDPGVPILGDWSWFEKADREGLAVICAVGDPAARKRLVEKAQSLGLLFTNAISPSAHILPDAKIGIGVMVFPHAVISKNVLLADHAIINAGSTLSHDTRIERYGTISPGVHLAGNVSVGEGCYLGIGSSVIPRVSIGAWTTIGAGAVVTDDIPSYVTAAGVPARIINTKRPS